MASTLRIELSTVGRGCEQDPTPAAQFPAGGNYAILLTCAGQPVVKAGKNLGPIAFDHGYTEIKDVDPGTYLVLVLTNPFHIAGQTFQSNMVSIHQVVVCECCDDVCVRIYQPGWHNCFAVNLIAARWLGIAGVLKADVVDQIATGLQQALQVGRPDPTDAAIIQVVNNAARAFQGGTPGAQG